MVNFAALRSQEAKTIVLAGGLDRTTAPDVVSPGKILSVVNYEGSPRGYRSMDGYERLDGQPKPSEASYAVLDFDHGNTALVAGQTVTGATSGATGKLLVDGHLDTGTYGGSDAAGFLILYNVTGDFIDNENIQVGGVTKAQADGTQADRGADNDDEDNDFLQLAIEARRAVIAAVPGSGPLRGVQMFNGTAYAFRDNAGGTACVMWKSTATGWQAVTTTMRWLNFTSGGAYVTKAGDTITGATSAKTATVLAVVVQSGSFSGGDAAGVIYIDAPSGAFVAENLNVGANLNVATIAANYTTLAILPGGKYRFRVHNFFGASALKYLYGCDGVNRGFMFDGTRFYPIFTGMAADAPNRIEVHKNQLFFAFPGGSAQHSAPGNPLSWAPILGAAEIGIGEEITDMLSAVSGVLAIWGENTVAVLYGNNVTDWQLVVLSRDAGGKSDTAQNMNEPFYQDLAGIRRLSATQNYGNFNFGTISTLYKSILDQKKLANVYAVGSMRVRAKDSYRLFMSDGSGFNVYMGRQNSQGATVPEGYFFDYGTDKVATALCSFQDDDSGEVLLMGTEDGFVYQLDAGTSADGEDWEGHIRFAYNNLKSPMVNKAWKKATVMLDCDANTTLGMVAELDYGNEYTPPAEERSFDIAGGGGNWDESYYNEAYWSSTVNGRAECDIDGIGPSISLCVFFSAKYQKAHTLQTITFNYAMRGLVK